MSKCSVCDGTGDTEQKPQTNDSVKNLKEAAQGLVDDIRVRIDDAAPEKAFNLGLIRAFERLEKVLSEFSI